LVRYGYRMPSKTPKATIWVSAAGHKHQLATATGRTSCGLRFTEPYPDCTRSDPICKDCMRAMRGK
jgi:hypothetical protein